MRFQYNYGLNGEKFALWRKKTDSNYIQAVTPNVFLPGMEYNSQILKIIFAKVKFLVEISAKFTKIL
jgi:hypothetical protein